MSGKHSDAEDLYEIQVLGDLERDWQQWFNSLTIVQANNPGQQPTTTLLGRVTDQSALRGLLCKLWDLNLTLVSVRRIDERVNQETTND